MCPILSGLSTRILPPSIQSSCSVSSGSSQSPNSIEHAIQGKGWRGIVLPAPRIPIRAIGYRGWLQVWPSQIWVVQDFWDVSSLPVSLPFGSCIVHLSSRGSRKVDEIGLGMGGVAVSQPFWWYIQRRSVQFCCSAFGRGCILVLWSLLADS